MYFIFHLFSSVNCERTKRPLYNLFMQLITSLLKRFISDPIGERALCFSYEIKILSCLNCQPLRVLVSRCLIKKT